MIPRGSPFEAETTPPSGWDFGGGKWSHLGGKALWGERESEHGSMKRRTNSLVFCGSFTDLSSFEDADDTACLSRPGSSRRLRHQVVGKSMDDDTAPDDGIGPVKSQLRDDGVIFPNTAFTRFDIAQIPHVFLFRSGTTVGHLGRIEMISRISRIGCTAIAELVDMEAMETRFQPHNLCRDPDSTFFPGERNGSLYLVSLSRVQCRHCLGYGLLLV